MGDRTYCDNTSCPFKDCDRHFSNIKVSTLVSVASFGADCRRYIGSVRSEEDKCLMLNVQSAEVNSYATVCMVQMKHLPA